MPLYIQTNVASLEVQRNLAKTQGVLAKSFQRLSSGYRINSASDDPSGLSISEGLRMQIRSYAAAERNAANGISMADTADGALSSISDLLSRMREIAVQGSNGDLTTTDRSLLQVEFAQLRSEIDRVSISTVFNGTSLLGSAAPTVAFQVNIFNNSASIDRITITFAEIDTTALVLSAGNASVGGTVTNAQSAITSIDAALVTVNGARASVGGATNRLSITIANLQAIRTNLSAAQSRIRDVDVAEETSILSRTQVVAQAGASVLAQANQMPSLALTLLR